jgi:Protein of unknown function (DUF3106)
MFDQKPVAVCSIFTAVLALAISGSVMAQAPATPATLSTPSATAAKAAPQAAKAVEAASGPAWAELTSAQKTALAPLAASWSGINESQKRKWLEISRTYPRLSPAEQTTMNSRMNEWVTMTPQQRAQARLNFAKTKELSTDLTPDEKKAKWETYQALSPEEKKGLAAAAVPKPAGAATAVKPVAPQKLVLLPKGRASSAASAPASSPQSSPVSAPAATVSPPAPNLPAPAQAVPTPASVKP